MRLIWTRISNLIEGPLSHTICISYPVSDFFFFSLRCVDVRIEDMGLETEVVEQRLKSFLVQLRTEFGILHRIVYKNKNQHRRSTYFQFLLKVVVLSSDLHFFPPFFPSNFNLVYIICWFLDHR